MSDATERISDEEIVRLAERHLEGLGVFDGPGKVQPQVIAFVHALLASEGERVAGEGIRVTSSKGPIWATPYETIRAMLGVPAREETRG